MRKMRVASRIKHAPLVLLGMAFILALLIFTLFPVVYAILGSFKTNFELVSGAGLFPEKWHWENFIYAFEKLNFFRYTINSFLLS